MAYIKYEDLENSIDKEFGSKKKYVSKLANIYKKIGFSDETYKRVRHCGDWLEFDRYDDDTYTLHHANFCFDRLCPICNRRRALKLFNQVASCVDVLQQQYDFVFLTLTVKNCSGDDLQKVVDSMFYSFSNRFLRYRKIANAFQGCFRSFEVTVDNHEFITRDMYFGNRQRHLKSRKKYYDVLGLKIGDRNPNFLMYHPHFHIIVAVPNGYANSPDYITQDEICCLWQKAMRLDYKPICDIRSVKGKNIKNDKDFCSAVAEVAKYSVKASDYLSSKDNNINSSIIKILHPVLSGRRLVCFYGIFSDVRQSLKYKDDVIDGDLVDVDNSNIDNNKTLTHLYYYHWNGSKYFHYHTFEVDYAYITSRYKKYSLDISFD